MAKAVAKGRKKGAFAIQGGKKQLKLFEPTPEERLAARLFYARRILRAFEKLVPEFRKHVYEFLLAKETKDWSTENVRIRETLGKRPSILYEKACEVFPPNDMAGLASITKEDLIEYIQRMDPKERETRYKKHGVSTPEKLAELCETTKTYPVIDVDLKRPIPEEELAVVYALSLKGLKVGYRSAMQALRRQQSYSQRLQRELASYEQQLTQLELPLPSTRKLVA